jgi:predicted acyltransferase
LPLYKQIVKRTIILILLGWFLQLFWSFDFSTMRIPGVLVRIGVCYFFASMIILHFNRRAQIIWVAGLLLGYWAIMTLIPFPGRGADPWAFGSNFAQYLDNLLLKGHMWKPDFDPEGTISTIPAIAQVVLGYFTGVWLRTNQTQLEKTTGMFISANILLVTALIWEFWMPINKQLWTSSYVLYTTGIALHFLAISYWLIDIKGYSGFTKPFVIYGSNAILAYFGSSLMAKISYMWTFTKANGSQTSIKGFIYNSILEPVFGHWLGSLVHPLLYILLWLAILAWFYKQKIFIKI